MSIERFYASQSVIVKDSNPAFKDNISATVSSSSSPSVLPTKIGMLFRFNIPEEKKYLIINDAEIGVYHSTSLTSGFNAILDYEFHNLKNGYNEETAKFSPETAGEFGYGGEVSLGPSSLRPTTVTEYATSEARHPETILKNGAYFCMVKDVYPGDWENVNTMLYSTRSANKPYIELNFNSTKASLEPGKPSSSGRRYLDSNQQNQFSWTIKDPTDAYYGDLRDGATAEVQWRNGTSGQISSVQAESLTAGTVPANTFPRTSELPVRVKLVDAGGTTSYSEWVTFSTYIRLLPTNYSPANGFVDEHKSKFFSWGLSATAQEFFNALTANAEAGFQWRPSAEGETSTIRADTLYGVTIQAETFPSTGNPQWRVKITDSYGNEESSSWMTLTTTDSAAVGTPIYPSNVVISDEIIEFRWNHSNATGTDQSAADLQYYNGTGWVTFKTVSGSEKSTTEPASTFTGGEVQWRVRTYNSDDIAGNWSAPLTFILVAAPQEPSISVDAKPFAGISWQSASQQAYKITLDGELIKKAYGTDKAYSFTLPLEDGQHTVGVSIQGTYGLWSQEALATFNVSNDPDDGSISLTAISCIDAQLSWQSEGAGDFFLIYRDGKAVGKTNGESFEDRLAAGVHGYSVVMKLTDGNYVRSNTANAWSGSKTPAICEFPGGQWVELKLSERSSSEQNYSYSRIATSRHVMGAEYPVIEMSEFSDMSASYDAAFIDTEDAREFERLKGKIVLIKSRAEEPIVAAMTALEKKTGDFYLSYTFTVQRIHWEDFIDETDS